MSPALDAFMEEINGKLSRGLYSDLYECMTVIAKKFNAAMEQGEDTPMLGGDDWEGDYADGMEEGGQAATAYANAEDEDMSAWDEP